MSHVVWEQLPLVQRAIRQATLQPFSRDSCLSTIVDDDEDLDTKQNMTVELSQSEAPMPHLVIFKDDTDPKVISLVEDLIKQYDVSKNKPGIFELNRVRVSGDGKEEETRLYQARRILSNSGWLLSGCGGARITSSGSFCFSFRMIDPAAKSDKFNLNMRLI